MRRFSTSDLFGRSLSSRVLWLTVGIILLVEILLLMPSMGQERQNWLWERITRAHLAAFSVATAAEDGKGGVIDVPTRMALLQLAGAESIKLSVPGQGDLTLMQMPVQADHQVNLGTEGMWTSVWRSDESLVGLGGDRLEVTAPSPLQKNMTVQIIVNARHLADHLRSYVANIVALSIVIALITGLLLFAALNRLLVRPMRIMTASIVGFRQDPERPSREDLGWLSRRRDDEISGAARELAVMQDELRAALWRNARLAALGTAVVKISHDLRNILASALLVTDRLQENADPAARRAAGTLIPAVERAAALVSKTVDFAREGPPAIVRAPVALRPLVDEVATAIVLGDDKMLVKNLVPDNVVLALDRAQVYRVLSNLLRNAAEAGANLITLSIEGSDGTTSLLVADDGPGVPKRVLDNLFKPFTGTARRGGTGLGLAIARDLVRAHGGDLVLRRTGPDGTAFSVGLASSDVANIEAKAQVEHAVKIA